MLTKLLAWLAGFSAPSPSLYQESIERFRRIPPPDQGIYRELRSIDVIFPTIDVYLAELTRANFCLTNDKLYQYSSDLFPQPIRRQAFYLSSANQYLDVPLIHQRYVDAAIELLQHYERMESTPHLSGLQQANLYRLLPFINNLMNLSTALHP